MCLLSTHRSVKVRALDYVKGGSNVYPRKYYLVGFKTGKLTFEADGKPTVTQPEYQTVLHFATEGKAQVVIDTVAKVLPADMKPGILYQLLFQAPEPTFDEQGLLKRPKFAIEGFYNGTDIAKVAPFNMDVFELSAAMPETVSAFFKDEEPACPLSAVETVAA